jgi:hypothetical protein
MDRARLVAASVAVNRLPHGSLRIARREELLAAAEQSGDLGAIASVLLDLARDNHFLGNTTATAEATALARAWQIRRTNPEVFDEQLYTKTRGVFPSILDGLIRRRDLSRREIDRLTDEMEGFYRSSGFSLRAVYRSRYLIHVLAGEHEAANAQIEAMLSEPGDAHTFCEAFYHYFAALWFEQRKDWERAAQECRAMLIDGAVCKCHPSHVAKAHSELMHCLQKLGRTEEARAHRDVGYPLVRGQEKLGRAVMQHVLIAEVTRDTEYGLRVIQDHVGWLSRDGGKVGEQWQLAVTALRFLGRLESEGGGERQLTREVGQGDGGGGREGAGGDRGESRVVTVAQLRAELDAELVEFAMKRDAAAGDGKFQRILDKYRYKPDAVRGKVVAAESGGPNGREGEGGGEAVSAGAGAAADADEIGADN